MPHFPIRTKLKIQFEYVGNSLFWTILHCQTDPRIIAQKYKRLNKGRGHFLIPFRQMSIIEEKRLRNKSFLDNISPRTNTRNHKAVGSDHKATFNDHKTVGSDHNATFNNTSKNTSKVRLKIRSKY
jgi:hypothetical protein